MEAAELSHAKNGYVVTNNHVIENSMSTRSNELLTGARIEVILPREPDKRYPATVVGRDSETDLALLKIEADDLIAADLGDSDDLRVGELAVAIGNPGGSEFLSSVTAGVISGLDRNIGWKSEEGNVYTLIQPTRHQPCNSQWSIGQQQGEVIGVNTSRFSDRYEIGIRNPHQQSEGSCGILIENGLSVETDLVRRDHIHTFTEQAAKTIQIAYRPYIVRGCWIHGEDGA